MLIALVAVLVFSGACIPKAEAVPGEVIPITAQALYTAYEKDEAAADALYKGRTLEITGRVSISRFIVVTDQYILVLNSEAEPIYNSWGVQCNFNTTQPPPPAKTGTGATPTITPRPRLDQVEKNKIVVVRGRCDGLQQDVVIRDCELLAILTPTPTPSPSPSASPSATPGG